MGKVRFYLDEHVDPDVARALRRRGVNVITAQEAQQQATNDMILFRTAAADGRVFVSVEFIWPNSGRLTLAMLHQSSLCFREGTGREGSR